MRVEGADDTRCEWSLLGSVSNAGVSRRLHKHNNVRESHHEPLEVLSGVLKGLRLRWTTVDKEGFVIVSTFQRLEYVFWGGVYIYFHHQNTP